MSKDKANNPYWVGKEILKSGMSMGEPYPENTHHWLPGDLVIHRADAKKIEMLMKVIGYTATGLCITEYCNKTYMPNMKQKYHNEIKCLLDPRPFGLILV